MATQNDVSAFLSAAQPMLQAIKAESSELTALLTLLTNTLSTTMSVQNYIMSRLDPIQPLKATAASA